MLNTILEYRKGILFVRLKGVLDRYTLQNFKVEVSDLIKKNGIKDKYQIKIDILHI